jgi:hypothetical protein
MMMGIGMTTEMRKLMEASRSLFEDEMDDYESDVGDELYTSAEASKYYFWWQVSTDEMWGYGDTEEYDVIVQTIRELLTNNDITLDFEFNLSEVQFGSSESEYANDTNAPAHGYQLIVGPGGEEFANMIADVFYEKNWGHAQAIAHSAPPRAPHIDVTPVSRRQAVWYSHDPNSLYGRETGSAPLNPTIMDQNTIF